VVVQKPQSAWPTASGCREDRRGQDSHQGRVAPANRCIQEDAADLALARKQAEQKGLPYQTYIKSLLHETLAEREKQKVG
jgi:hypothetical protein